MTTLLLGLLLFLGIHSLAIIDHELRDRLAARFGELGWKAIYSLISLLGFVLMLRGYGAALGQLPMLFTPPQVLKTAATLLMLPVFPLLVAAYFPGKIKELTSHPMLLATKLFALAHLLVSSSLAGLLLYGSLLIWAILDRISLDRRPSRPAPGAPAKKYNDAIALTAGLAFYLYFLLAGHGQLLGVALF